MRPIEWERALRALESLRCQVLRETDEYISVVRGAIRKTVIRKAPLSVPAQRQIMRHLELSESEWIAAVRAAR